MKEQEYIQEPSINKEKHLQELLICLRFAAVGAVATIIHISVAWLLVTRSSLQILELNFVAFLVAFLFSFVGNYHWTFEKPGNQRRAIFRLFAISSTAFIVNSIALSVLIEIKFLTPALSIVVAALIIPVVTFLFSRLWVFKVTA